MTSKKSTLHIALILAAVGKIFFNKKKVSHPTISYQDRNINDHSTSNNKEGMVSQPKFSKSPKKTQVVDYKNYPQQSTYQTTMKGL